MADGSIIISAEIDDSNLNKDVKKLEGNFSKIGNVAKTAFKGVAVAVGAVSTAMVAGITAGVKYNATIEQYQTSFEVMTGSAEKAADVVERLKKLGAETPFEMTDLADTTQLLMNYGLTADEAIEKMQMLGDISQGSADKMNRIAMAYGQMSSAGKVQLEDIKQMIEAGFNPLQEISQSTGESMASLYDRISKGTISVDEITASMERSTSAGGKYFQSMDKQSQTINGQLSTLKDNAQQLLGTLSEGISSVVSGNVLPSLNNILGNLQTAFQTGGIEGFATQLGKSLTDLAGQITQALPQFIETGTKIISNLITGIAQSLPTLIPQAVQCIVAIVTGLLNNIDKIIDAGLQLIMGLVEGLINAIPELINAIPNIITGLVNGIVNNLPKIIEAGIQLILSLATGLIQAIPQLVMAIPQIVGAILEGLWELPGKIWEILVNVVTSIYNWGVEMQTKATEAVSGFFTNVINWFSQLPRKYLELAGTNNYEHI